MHITFPRLSRLRKANLGKGSSAAKTPTNPVPVETFTKIDNRTLEQRFETKTVNRGWKGRLTNAAIAAGSLAAHTAAGALLGPAGLLVVPAAAAAVKIAKAAKNGKLKNLSFKQKALLATASVGFATVAGVALTVGMLPAAALATGASKVVVAGITGAAWGALDPTRGESVAPKPPEDEALQYHIAG